MFLYKTLFYYSSPKGMHAYLTEHSYKNTQTEDLWRALTDASQVGVCVLWWDYGVANNFGLLLGWVDCV